MKKIFLFLLVIVLVIVGFYFWASASAFDESQYLKTISSSSTTTHDSTALKVMTYNIGYLSGMTNNRPVGRKQELFQANLDHLAKLVFDEDIDLLAVQEIDFNSSRSFDINQFQEIHDRTGFSSSALAVNWDKNYIPYPYWPIRYQFGQIYSGQAVFSKYPIISNKREELIKPIDQPFYYNDFYLDRLIQINPVKINDTTSIVIMNVHLEAFSEPTRKLHLQTVYRLFNEYAKKGPALLLGDFNEPAPIDTLTGMKKFYANENFKPAISLSELKKELKKHFTYSSGSPKRKIDYIFYTNEYIEKINASTIREKNLLSDHLPVMMTFKLINVE